MNKLIPWLLVLIAVTLIFGQAAAIGLLWVMVGIIALGFVVLCLIKWSDAREKKRLHKQKAASDLLRTISEIPSTESDVSSASSDRLSKIWWGFVAAVWWGMLVVMAIVAAYRFIVNTTT